MNLFYEFLHSIVKHIPGLTDDAVTELGDAIDQHQAEHEATVKYVQAQAPQAGPEDPPAAAPVPAQDPPPAPPAPAEALATNGAPA